MGRCLPLTRYNNREVVLDRLSPHRTSSLYALPCAHLLLFWKQEVNPLSFLMIHSTRAHRGLPPQPSTHGICCLSLLLCSSFFVRDTDIANPLLLLLLCCYNRCDRAITSRASRSFLFHRCWKDQNVKTHCLLGPSVVIDSRFIFVAHAQARRRSELWIRECGRTFFPCSRC